jgi:predicted aconitase with swiveling domain
MLELLRRGIAPAAVLMAEADAILSLGVVVAGELGYSTIPVVEVATAQLEAWDEETATTMDKRTEGGGVS